MAKIAEEEVNTYLNTFNFAEKDFRIVMIGHSMGGLILRSIASTISYQ
jgi:alpha-beta hydrolase superfamily lysophospholipase